MVFGPTCMTRGNTDSFARFKNKGYLELRKKNRQSDIEIRRFGT